jgi:argininosuccinate lyase
LRKISAKLDVDLAEVFDVRRSLKQRQAIGAPSPINLKAQIERWRKEVG